MAIYSDPENFSWFAYGVCKAVWLGEPEHRERLLGSRERKWSTTEERECLANLVVYYRDARKDGKTPEDPALERLGRIFDADLMNGFILYEMMARPTPDYALLLPDESRQEVRTYIARYVLVPRVGSGERKTDPEGGA